MKLAPGTRIRHVSGRTGRVTKRIDKQARGRGVLYYMVALDPPKANDFEPDEMRTYGRDITPVAPKLHERWEAEWAKAPFVDRAWAVSV